MIYATSICPFESGKCGKEGETKEIKHIENEKSFFDEIKTFFLSFSRAIIWVKKRN